MKGSVNKIILVGTVGRDPDVMEGREKIAHVALATARAVEDATERTDWHRLTVKGRLAQFVEEHVVGGDRLYVEGRLHYDSFERDGVTIPTAEIEVRELVRLLPYGGGASVGS